MTGSPRSMFSATTRPKTSPPREGTTTTEASAKAESSRVPCRRPAKQRARREARSRLALKSLAFRPVADDEQFERAILHNQNARRLEQSSYALGRDRPALKDDYRRMGRPRGMHLRRTNKLQTMGDGDNSRKL